MEDLLRVKGYKSTLKLTLPLPPSVNHMYCNTKHGGKRLTKLAIEYVRISTALINQAIEDQQWRKQPKGVWLYVDLAFYFQDRRIRDASNCLKLLLDVMQGRIFENDMNALPRIQTVEYDKAMPRVVVQVTHQTEKHREEAIGTLTG